MAKRVPPLRDAFESFREGFREYWKAFIETLIIGILLVAFSQTNNLLFFFAIVYSITDIIVMIYSAYQGDPKYLIVELLSHVATGGSRHG